MKKAISVTCDPGPLRVLFVLDEEGRLWRGEGRAGFAQLRWSEESTPQAMMCDPAVVYQNMQQEAEHRAALKAVAAEPSAA